jgi:hypothetical protein
MPAEPGERGAKPTLSAMAELTGATTAWQLIMLGAAGVANNPASARIAYRRRQRGEKMHTARVNRSRRRQMPDRHARPEREQRVSPT